MLISEQRQLREKREVFFRLVSIFLVVFLAAGIVLRLITAFWLSPVEVDGISMEGTLFHGDVLLLNKQSGTPSRGEVVVVDKDGRGNLIIKRVAGLAGDVLWTKNGTLFRIRAGEDTVERADAGESWDDGRTFAQPSGATDMEATVVPDGCVFVLGDNRTHSQDSRYYGAFPCERVLGVVPEWSIESKKIWGFLFG